MGVKPKLFFHPFLSTCLRPYPFVALKKYKVRAAASSHLITLLRLYLFGRLVALGTYIFVLLLYWALQKKGNLYWILDSTVST